MRQSEIVHLEINTWAGTAIGAVHYYGELIGYSPYLNVKVQTRLTKKRADKLNNNYHLKHPGAEHWEIFEPGDMSDKYDTPSQVKRVALRMYKRHFPKAKILLLGNPAYHEVKLVLDGPRSFKEVSRLAYKQCELLGWYDHGREDDVDAIYDKWHNALKQILKD